MRKTINRNLLRHAVSQKMFCGCGQCLDVRSAVAVDVFHGSELKASGISCAVCYDKRAASLQSAATERGMTLEVIDGRSL